MMGYENYENQNNNRSHLPFIGRMRSKGADRNEIVRPSHN